MKKDNLLDRTSWKSLKKHFNDIKYIHIRDLFEKDKNRFKNFSICFEEEILVDFSKNRVTYETMRKLLNLAKEINLSQYIKRMFSGKKINYTENRSVLHIALRNRGSNPIFVENKNIMIEINSVLKKMKVFSKKIIKGKKRGCQNDKILNVVNIGIGGSNLGPKMVLKALSPYRNHLNFYFISNIDGTNIKEVLKNIDPFQTIFLVSSKTFSTIETITNFLTVKSWFMNKVKKKEYFVKHFFALSENITEVQKYGIPKKNIFKIWNWVGGRYSVWSAISLPVMLSIGYKNFISFLEGAYSMDQHFYTSKFEKNIPVLLALIGVWYNNFFRCQTEAIFPYDDYLEYFVSYIQQMNMESNGKNVDKYGNDVRWDTGPIVWGEVGVNGQHSFYQLLHQGTKLIPCDFILPMNSHNEINDHHLHLVASALSQTKSLAFGKKFEEVETVDSKKHININNDNNFAVFKKFNGNSPTNSIFLRKITPYSLGCLIALYEHKVFVQGVIWSIFSFDQWGVELGKTIEKNIFLEMKNKKKNIVKYDSSTNGLINFYFNSKNH